MHLHPLPTPVTAIVVSGLLTAETSLPDSNLVLNILTIALIVVFGPRYIKTSNLKSQTKELMEVIDGKNTVISAKDEQLGQLSQDLQGASTRADAQQQHVEHLRAEVVEWKARYDEQKQYTAEPALNALNGVLEKMHQSDEHWQNEMIGLNNAVIYLLKRLIDEAEGREGKDKLAKEDPPPIVEGG